MSRPNRSDPMPPTPPDRPAMPDFPVTPVHPDLLEWVKQTLDPAQVLEEMQEFERTGGQPLDAFLADIESVVRGS